MAGVKLWYGMGVAAWLRLLRRNAFAVDRQAAGVAAAATLLSLRNSAIGALQDALRRIDPGPPLPADPVIVLGHWRCGTTLLHELLAADPRHTAPTTCECLAPSHFRITRPVALRLVSRWLPQPRRPMDAMPLDWHSPQEDDLAMLALGEPTLYERIGFPSGSTDWTTQLDTPRWRRLLTRFLRDVLAHRPGRLILKSPLHMARVPALLELFPRAVFVHIVRDPYVVFPSTVHMWQSLQREHGLQRAGSDLPDFVLGAFDQLHRRFEAARGLIAHDRLIEIRYEDLSRDPRQTLADVYARAQLGAFSHASDAVDAYLDARRGYQTNRYVSEPAADDRVSARWRTIIERYGYAVRGRAALELHPG